MEDRILNLEFLWLPKIEDLSEINFEKYNLSENELDERKIKRLPKSILSLKQSLSKYCGFPVYITTFKPKLEFEHSDKIKPLKSKSENSLFYAEYIYDIACHIKLEKDVDDDYKRFINMFCSCNKGKLDSELWLKLNTSIFSNQQISTNTETIELSKFSFGNFTGLNTYVEHFDSKTSLTKYGYKITQTRLELFNDYKNMVLYFVVGKILPVKKRNSCTHLLHKLEIQYNSLHSVIISKGDTLSVFLHVLEPPLMYAVNQKMDEEEDFISFFELNAKTPWFRAVDLFDESTSQLRKEFTMNTTIKIDLKGNEYEFLFQLLIHCKKIEIFFAPMTVIENFSDHIKSIEKINNKFKSVLNFDCFYAMQCLLTFSYEIIDQMLIRKEFETFETFITEKNKENPLALSEALYIIYDAINKGNIIAFFYCLKDMYERLQNTNFKPRINSDVSENNDEIHLLFIKRVIVIPSHFYMMPPQPTLKSRALRDCDPNYSLRVSIKDAGSRNINFTVHKGFFKDADQREMDFYNRYFKKPLLQGLKIGNRNYKYIGSSTSQLKGHGMWFYAKDEQGLNADILRKNFGALEKITKVPKYMARMGQTFSQSMGHITVPQEWTNINDPDEDIEGGCKQYLILNQKKSVEEDDDVPEYFLVEAKEDTEDIEVNEKEIFTEDSEPYVFSDGIGRISKELAEEVYKEFHLEEIKPSAMQIRYAGCKGMLVVDPELEGKQIRFRKSMKKFDSDNDSLEILKFSVKRVACLNRPFITILEQLGIHKDAFLELQRKMIQNHITSMFDEYSAYQFLNRHALLRISFLKIYYSGIRFTEDPLFRTMIFSLFQKQIELLKSKASIEIPVEDGRTFFGVLDETHTLEYGQVFIQYSDWETNKPIIKTGTVIVTKNPCMHPGDVRRFEAVDVIKLHHIVDCIVFPAKGPRPHPDEMAGSDLDGDEYHAMWLNSMEFPENYEPMHFAQKNKKENLIKPVTPSDELDHFGNYIFNDDVGLVASAHLAQADCVKGGIFSDVCLSLAKKYAISLDFAKSGICTKIGKDRARKYPDFMEKLDNKITYLSRKALGHLFRNCKKLELGLDTEKNEIEYCLDTELEHDNYKKYEKSARRMLKQYTSKIERFMRTYGFESEGQLLAGALINPPKYYENRHDMDNLIALLEYEIHCIFNDLERRFFSEFNGKPKDGKFTDEMHQKASAWYMASYKKLKGDSSYFGFPWAVADVLADLKLKNKKDKQIMPSKTILENVVDQSISKHMQPHLTPETDIEVIFKHRVDVLDLAYKVLLKWIKTQRDYFSETSFKQIEKVLETEFGEITAIITSCNKNFIKKLKMNNEIKTVISPCYYVIQTILKIAQTGVYTGKSSDILHEFSLLSWITLIKLYCTYNPQYLGIPNEAGEIMEAILYKAQDCIIDTIQLPLNLKYIPFNKDFTKFLLTDEPAVRDYLMDATKLKDIEFRHLEGRDGNDYVRVTVRGTRYSIEKLKDIVVMDNFYECVFKNQPLY